MRMIGKLLSRCFCTMGRKRVVDTPSGKLRGSIVRSCMGEDYYSFKGIPYAKPPVGPLRFADPKPVEPWTGVRDALEHGSISLQYDFESNAVVGSEDCLFANVYTKNLDVNRRAPVMVFFHPGSGIMGSGNDDLYGPDYLLTKDVVLVTCNYRLGIFGFCDLGIAEEASGIQSLKDSLMVLKWVNKHISAFGGNPDNVTAFGCSAGGMFVHYLALSPYTKGLIHKVISQSGNVFTIGTVKYEGKPYVDQLLEALGSRESDPKVSARFLKSADAKKLIEIQSQYFNPRKEIQFDLPISTILHKSPDNLLASEDPIAAAKRGLQLPFMMGGSVLETGYMLQALESIDLDHVDKNLEQYCNENFFRMTCEHYGASLEDFRKLYFGDERISESNVDKFIGFVGDYIYKDTLYRLAKVQRQKSCAPTYVYELSYAENIGIGKRKIKSKYNERFRNSTFHEDELTYLFKARIFENSDMKQLQEDTEAERVMRQMVEMWTNFAYYGTPTPSTSELIPIYWQPLSKDSELHCLSIGDKLEMKKIRNMDELYSFNKRIIPQNIE